HIFLSNRRIQMAVEAATMATKLLCRYCWAFITKPISTNKSSKPVIAAVLINCLFQIGSCLFAHQANNKIPAVVNRIAPKINGGKPCKAIWIKKYVEPHTI